MHDPFLESDSCEKKTINQKQLSQLKISTWGRFIYFVLPIRKKIVFKNIDIVFQETLTAPSKIKLAQAFYTHLITSIKELICMPFMKTDALQSMVDIEGINYLKEGLEQGKGIILLTGHLGNWELAPIIGIPMLQITNKFYVIRKPIKTRWLESWLYRSCEKAGITILSAKRGLNRVRALLAQNGTLHFAFDQHVGTHTSQGIKVPFFNKPAGTYRSLAVLVHRTQAVIVPMSTFRLNNGKHVVKFHPPLKWCAGATIKEAIYDNTLYYNQIIEDMILAHPEQWWWVHKRWKVTG